MTAETRSATVWGMRDDIALESFAAYQRAIDLSETTIRHRDGMLRHLQRSVGSLLDATTHEIRLHLGRAGIAASSRRTERNAFRAFYKFTHQEGLTPTDPSERLDKVRVPRGEPRPFTWAQVEAMLNSGAYTKTRAMILLGYYQGFRVSSICAVHGHDIDHLAGRIRTIGKGDKPRSLPLHPVIAALAHTMPTDGYWFPARGREGHIRPASVSERIYEAKLRAGIRDPRLTAHSLRHSFGTDLVEQGVDIRVIRELMMHESLSSTEIYTGVSEQRKMAGIVALPVRAIPARSGRKRAA